MASKRRTTASPSASPSASTLVLIFMLIPGLLLPPAAHPFGKNKVQYQVMSWEQLPSPYYTLYYHQDQGALPEVSYLWLDDIYRDLSRRFEFKHSAPVPVVIYESPALFEQTNIITELLPEEVGGFTEMFKNRVAVPFNGSFADLRHVLHHEMVHAFVFGMVFDGNLFRAAGAQVPLWFNEGLAEVLSSGWDRGADMFMLDRVLNSTVPPPGPMLDGYLAYKGGQSFLYYLYSTGGDSLFNRMLIEFKLSRTAEASIERVYKKKLDELGKEWIGELRRIYWPEIGRRLLPADQGASVTGKGYGRMNLRPRVSPDGSKVAFFSDRHDYARIIIADTQGLELRVIGQHSLGASFESFRPMTGALCWSPEGKEVAFVAKRGGRDEIRVVDASNGKTALAIRLPLTAINGLDWSRDGKLLTFTGISYGQADLYLYDMATQGLTVLVDSHESKASPRFAPDGKKIIFAMTDTAGLMAGPLSGGGRATSNIAVYDIERDSCYLLTNAKWNDLEPAFSPDGSEFVFVSDRNGVDNLYIAKLSDPSAARPLTDYVGSCSNPDWAADGSAIVFDLFMNQSWNIWRMDRPHEKLLSDTALALTRWAEHEVDPSIPFFKKKAPAVDSAMVDSAVVDSAKASGAAVDGADSVNTRKRGGAKKRGNEDRRAIGGDGRFDDGSIFGFRKRRDGAPKPYAPVAPADSVPDSKPYSLRFTPDLVAVGLDVNTYYGAYGQALAMFSDIMGDHRITVAGDLQLDFSDYAQVFALYEYMKHRVNVAGGAFYYRYYSYDGLFRRYYHDLEAGGIVGLSYPNSIFSRADLNMFLRYIEREPISGDDNAIITSNALLASAGYTFDNILWGITGPLRGLRARASLQLAPPLAFTDEAYLSGDIDIRHYTHFLKRYVWANRLTFGGTVGLGVEGKASRKFFLGGSENWFNYDINVDNYANNLQYNYYSDIVSPLRGWNYFDITGDRMLLVNTEFRFPFIREVSTVWPIPMQIRYINGALFMDAGYAWTRAEQEEGVGWLPIPPRMAGGYGFGMRANLGIFVLRYDRGWPTDFKRAEVGRPINYFSLGAEF